jgi:hypothetical protein
MAYAYNPSTQENEAWRCEFEGSLGCIVKSCAQQKRNNIHSRVLRIEQWNPYGWPVLKHCYWGCSTFLCQNHIGGI